MRHPDLRQQVVLKAMLILCCLVTCDLMAQRPPDTTPVGSPTKMKLCVSGVCENLIWRGDHYDGVKDNGDIANHYSVSQWNKGGVKFSGKSTSQITIPASPGVPFSRLRKAYIEGEFEGAIAADGLSVQDGVSNYNVGGQRGAKAFTLTWQKSQVDTVAETASACTEPMLPMPSAIEDCGGLCMLSNNKVLGAWTFKGKQGVGFWGSSIKATLTIQEWANGKVTVYREDWPDSQLAGSTMTYRGTVCGRSMKGDIAIRWPGHWNGDVVQPWTAIIPVTSCSGVPDDTAQLVEVGTVASRFRFKQSVFECFSRAADQGDRDARTATGLMYRDGIGTPVDSKKALAYLKAGAVQGDFNAEIALFQIYQMGVVVPADEKEATRWENAAHKNPVYLQAMANRQDAKEMQQTMFLGLSAIVESMMSPTIYIGR
jgi:hypothetical protein